MEVEALDNLSFGKVVGNRTQTLTPIPGRLGNFSEYSMEQLSFG